MAKVSVVVRDDGTLACIDNELTACFRPIGPVKTQRASHVEPINKPLRIVFHMLRLVCGDKGWVATFTRYWPCFWRVNICNGPILYGSWGDRQAAIDAEVEWLNEHLE